MGFETKPDIRPLHNRVLVGDCLTELKKIPSGSVDLVFADPPYNLQLAGDLTRPDQSKVDAVDDAWDKFASFADYDRFSRTGLSNAAACSSRMARFWVIGSYHNIFRIGAILQDLDFWILNDVIWLKTNPMPNFRGRRFTNAHETLIWASRGQDSRPTFNYDAMKIFNDDLQMRSDWLLPLCTGPERLKTATGEKVHPTQKPEALIYRVLLASSKPGDVVLDPFFGSGTTGAVARRLGRNFIGIERDPTYAEAARRRIAQGRSPCRMTCSKSRPASAPRRAYPSVHCSSAASSRRAIRCTIRRRASPREVRADGSIASRDASGSIHKIGAHVQGAEACNGWTFWHIRKGQILVPIDVLRQQLRAELGSAA